MRPRLSSNPTASTWSYQIFRATQLHGSNLKLFAAPVGFPFLVRFRDTASEIIEPVAAFLAWFAPVPRDPKFPAPQLRRKNSAEAMAADLRDWWEHLSVFGLNWDRVERVDVEQYRDSMLWRISPHTHRPYRPGTVRRRLFTIINFYDWATSQGLCNVSISFREPLILPTTTDQSGSAHAIKRSANYAHLLPKRESTKWSGVRYLSRDQYKAIAEQMGQLPTDPGCPIGQTPLRLVCDLMLNTGLRLNEALALTVSQAASLGPFSGNPMSVRYLRVTETKGGVPRNVPIPLWVICEIDKYVKLHRPTAMNAASIRPTSKIFLNGWNMRKSGLPLKAAYFRKNFQQAVINCGLTRRTLKYSLDSYAQTERTSHAFSPHCLRHTFAIWKYYQERKFGNPEPWKIIQAILGHAHLSTTTDLYLGAAGEFEETISDQFEKSVLAPMRD